MLKATASITSATWDQIVVNVGSSTDDASYKLEKKTGNGAYETVKTWDNGDLADAEFGEDYTDNVISTGTAYTYRVTATVQVKDANKNLRSWSNSAEVKATATGTKPAISVKSTKKGVATVSWKAVAGADGYDFILFSIIFVLFDFHALHCAVTCIYLCRSYHLICACSEIISFTTCQFCLICGQLCSSFYNRKLEGCCRCRRI